MGSFSKEQSEKIGKVVDEVSRLFSEEEMLQSEVAVLFAAFSKTFNDEVFSYYCSLIMEEMTRREGEKVAKKLDKKNDK